jgi:hypothetical protein
MTPAGRPSRIDLRSGLHELDATIAIVDDALAGFRPPPGWRVLRSSGRLEARWEGADGRWAQFSVRLTAGPERRRVEAPLLARPVGAGSLVVTFDSSDLGEETIATAMELLTPLQRLLARASEP